MTFPRSILTAILLLILITGCSRLRERRQVDPTASAIDRVEELQSSRETRRYRLHIPAGYQESRALPLVLSFHGYGSNASQQEDLSRMSIKADQAGFIAVYPEGLGRPQAWYIGSEAGAAADQQFIRDLVQHLQSRWSIDPYRIYATGMSNGAQMSVRLACEQADVFAAVAPVAGGYYRLQDCSPSRPVPLLAFHGTADRILPYAGDRLLLPIHTWAADWAARNACVSNPEITLKKGQVTGETWSGCSSGADVVLYTIDGGGHSWPGYSMPASITAQDINATDLIWEFFSKHSMP